MHSFPPPDAGDRRETSDGPARQTPHAGSHHLRAAHHIQCGRPQRGRRVTPQAATQGTHSSLSQ